MKTIANELKVYQELKNHILEGNVEAFRAKLEAITDKQLKDAIIHYQEDALFIMASQYDRLEIMQCLCEHICSLKTLKAMFTEKDGMLNISETIANKPEVIALKSMLSAQDERPIFKATTFGHLRIIKYLIILKSILYAKEKIPIFEAITYSDLGIKEYSLMLQKENAIEHELSNLICRFFDTAIICGYKNILQYYYETATDPEIRNKMLENALVLIEDTITNKYWATAIYLLQLLNENNWEILATQIESNIIEQSIYDEKKDNVIDSLSMLPCYLGEEAPTESTFIDIQLFNQFKRLQAIGLEPIGLEPIGLLGQCQNIINTSYLLTLVQVCKTSMLMFCETEVTIADKISIRRSLPAEITLQIIKLIPYEKPSLAYYLNNESIRTLYQNIIENIYVNNFIAKTPQIIFEEGINNKLMGAIMFLERFINEATPKEQFNLAK